MTKKQNVGRPRGSSPDPEEAKSGRLVASDKSLRFEGLHSHIARPRTYNNASPLCSFIIIMVVPAVFQSTRYRRRCNSVARSLTHYWANIKTPGGISGCVCRGCRSGTHTPRARSIAAYQWASERASDTDGVAHVVVWVHERELRVQRVKGKCHQHPGLIWAQLSHISCPRSSLLILSNWHPPACAWLGVVDAQSTSAKVALSFICC